MTQLTGIEMCVFDAQGVPLYGLTNGSSVFDMRLGKPGKRVVEVVSRAAGGEAIDVWADAGCNDLFGNLQEGGAIKQAWVAACDDHVRALYYDFEVLLDFLKVLPIETKPDLLPIGSYTSVADRLLFDARPPRDESGSRPGRERRRPTCPPSRGRPPCPRSGMSRWPPAPSGFGNGDRRACLVVER